MADDLEDEWWLDSTSAAQNEDDADDNEAEASAEPNKSQQSDTDAKQTTKRKAESVEENSSGNPEKKAKKSKRKKKIVDVQAQDDSGPEAGHLITALDRHYEGKLSAVERDEISLTESEHFLACNSSKEPPSLYLALAVPKWARKMDRSEKKPGSPLLLIICPAALRATQLNRAIEGFKGRNCKVAKLFAKHMKISEQVKFLSKSQVHIGIGTPSRIQALIENGSLNLSKAAHVVLDWSWRDVKMRRMSDIPEIRSDLFALLKTHLIPMAQSGQLKFGLL